MKDLDPHTCLALRPLVDAGSQAMQERDDYNTWACQLARTLGVSCSDFRSEDVGAQYAELRERITAALDAALANASHEPRR